ncbi:hypothetical protein CMI37_08380 [Candidatus Pacearchaeota archaeon]|nr:hypothetical protein [Candidatus Pacearchaeota archaeon]|tara:strand:- start:248 stop:448 length:201 start_codon:yes stop_codon:yes gene_type:complete
MGNKWTSRKFWEAMMGEVSGIVALVFGVAEGEMVTTIAGAVIIIAVTLGYLKAEKDIDVAKVNKGD